MKSNFHPERTSRLFLIAALAPLLAASCVNRGPILGATEPATAAPRTATLLPVPSFTPTPAPYSSVTPSTSPSPLPSFTPTASPTLPPSPSPTIMPTPTLLSGSAPSLPRLGVEFITNGDRSDPYVALTFDVGQTPTNPAGFDNGILRALLDHEAPATFFLGGDWMRTHISETRRLDGVPFFELGNHSWSHPDMRNLTEAQMTFEVLRTQDILYQITGRQTLLFRLPAGLYNDLALSVVAWHGLYTIQWDVVTADPVPDNDAENINRLVRERVQNGSIIVMHANGRGWHTAEALPEMIEYLRGEGYCLVTVSSLLGLGREPECPNG